MSGLQTVHVRVNDAATGQPTPVRIRFTDAEGRYYAPFGRLTEISSDPNEDVGGNLLVGPRQKHSLTEWAYIDGACEIALPADTIQVEIQKGPEYKPVHTQVVLAPGKMALRFQMERWADLRAERWYSGDAQAHFLSPHAALLEGAAEDLAVVNLLIREWSIEKSGRRPTIIPNAVAFSGQEPLLQSAGHMVAVNTLNSGGILGSLALLNSHRAVFPLSTGLRADFSIDWTLADWCDQCHRKQGLVLWTQFGLSLSGDPEGGFGGETLADLLLGKIDGIQIGWLDGAANRFIHEWYRLLNCGLHVPIVGGSEKVSNGKVLGAVRTYARLRPDQEFTYKNWIEAVRSGRTFTTNGPLLTLTINGHDPGEKIDLSANDRRVTICAEARSDIPFERLELVVNGSAAAAIEASGSPSSARLEGEFEVPGTCWMAARCWGDAPVFTSHTSQRIGAHTSPVYVNVPEMPLQPDPISIALLAERIESMRHWAEHGARFKTDKTRQDLLAVFEKARHALALLAHPASD